MSPPALDPSRLHAIVAAALEEDLGEAGDVTTAAVVGAGRRGLARLVAREDLVVAGGPVARAVFASLDPSLRIELRAGEGDAIHAGTVVMEVEGAAAPLLMGERTALNFLQRMCGIASATRRAVEEIAGTGVLLLDTRKTAPGLRLLDKYAVAAGGGTNHRMGLFDAVLIKDTHLAVAGPPGYAVLRALAHRHPREIVTVEVGSVEALEDAIRAGAGRALLDNMDLETLRRCVAVGKGKIVLEASGGLRPGSLRAVAETGVDALSIGWLTHSVRAADLAMDLEPRP